MLAQVTFRSDNKYTEKFGRDMADHQVDPGQMEMWDRFGVEGYLDYHGDKLVRRFDANSYLVISKAMEVHDLGRGRGGLETAMSRIAAPALVLGIDSDILYPLYQQELIRDVLVGQGNHVEFSLVRSHEGHDAFLIDLDQVGPPLQAFLEAEIAQGNR
jgi:homoserine O-acetyltransferase